MAGQLIVNYDGLSAEAAQKLAEGLVNASKAKYEALAGATVQMTKFTHEEADKAVKLLSSGSFLAGGVCGVGCC